MIAELISTFQLESTALGHLTSAVQFGFITGTLVFALFTIADRYSPSKVFMTSALLGALFNLAMIWKGHNLTSLIGLRFLTGFFLAGIYPVGMKIAADYYKKGLGKSLSFLVGALVLGTALPHLLRGSLSDLSWQKMLMMTSGLAVLGGFLMLSFVPDGPYRKAAKQLKLTACFTVFKNKKLRVAAIGYIGHMWELYAFWAFVPVIITYYQSQHPQYELNISSLTFSVIAVGSLGCILGGLIAQKWGNRQVAFIALLLSTLCCLSSPWWFGAESKLLFLSFLLIWGMTVIADSPLFSTLVAQSTADETKGTALTIVNCLGFAITIISIQLISVALAYLDKNYVFLILAIGPVISLFILTKKTTEHRSVE